MATTGTKLATLLNGHFVGRDYFNNRYYVSRWGLRKIARGNENIKPKRWVVYNRKNAKSDDASFVTPIWHRWLHHTSDEIPQGNRAEYDWQAPPLENITGTARAFYPDNHLPVRKDVVEQHYQPWQPPAVKGKFFKSRD